MIKSKKINTEMVAPVSGIVTALNVTAGKASDFKKPCAVISSTDALQVKISIYEKYLKNVQVGQKALISGVAFAKSGYSGTLTYISPSARQQTSSSMSETVVDAVVTLNSDEIDESLRIGLTAKAKLYVSNSSSSLVVPYEYVQQDEENFEYVYVAENNKAVKRIITTGDELSNGFCILSGLAAGDKVIENPEDISGDGTPVTITK
jgi:RND family efflux transporter MFP subunit